MTVLEKGLYYMDSLIIWRGIREDEVMGEFRRLLGLILDGEYSQLLDGYYSFLHKFVEVHRWDRAELSWQDYILDLILIDENMFSLAAEGQEYSKIPKTIIELADRDLQLLYGLANISWKGIVKAIENRTGHSVELIFKEDFKDTDREQFNSRYLAGLYRKNGCGQFGVYRGFRWRRRSDGTGYLEGIDNIDPIQIDDLIGYEIQKQRIIENTKLLLAGYSANNILLYGDKGTGKSSMVKAVLNKFYDKGLRVVEVPKESLGSYLDILSLLEHRGQKFIIFIDDLSFEDTEPEYKHIKALLEGGLKERPQNVVIYATSNRRHLIKQSFEDREEITPADAVQEKLSLSDRFGITLTFMSPSQREYIEIVKSIARDRDLRLDSDVLTEGALSWAMRYNGPSGRTARQFVDYIEGNMGIK